ncbi:glycosyltransferase family 4 protein, partial [Candidatus Uhrbacteria bacterium]|nr:glycosyltransferase family 4 protein [Candidatus Uhrbacteria bacterium]
MKIYFIGQKGIPATSGGVEAHVEEMATRLADMGHDVYVYTRSYYTPTTLKKYKGVNLIAMPTIKTKHLDTIVHTLLATLDVLSRDADIIHYHAVGPASLLWLPRLLKRSAKTVFTFHCQDYRHQKWGSLARTYLKFGEYVGTKLAHQVITVSQTLKKYVKNQYAKPAIYLPNGCPKVQASKSTAALAKWGLKKNNYILSVSRLIRHKGIHTLIQAYQQL